MTSAALGPRRPPPITLQRTFRDLYSEGNEDDGPKTVLVVVMPTATVQMTSQLPVPTRFAYQHIHSETQDDALFARLFLQLVPQMTGLVAGKLPLIIFDLDETAEQAQRRAASSSSSSPSQLPAHRLDALHTFAQLTPSQIPDVTFVARPSDIALAPGAKVAVVNPMDYLTHLPHLVDPEVHYDLLSKRALALSSLPSPPSHVIDTILLPPQIRDRTLLESEVARMLLPVRARSLPFVVKLPQALSGTGTFLLRTEPQRAAALAVLAPEVSRMLAVLSPSNAHLNPVSLVLQDMLPGEAVGLSLFVTKAGRVEFISCTHQIYDDDAGWSGGFISYDEQDRLWSFYAGTARKLAAYLHQEGYFGPVGVDVMTAEDGTQYIVDMNVRITGTMPLGFLRSVFVEGGLREAAIFFPLLLALSRDEFEARFEEEMLRREVVVVAWSHDEIGRKNAAIMVLAAGTKEGLKGLIARVNVFKIKE